VSIAEAFAARPAMPAAVTDSVARVLRSGRLFRYDGQESEAALLERDFAALVGLRYALATTSCSSAIVLALRALGIEPGDTVLCPAFTFAAVPGAIAAVGARPVLIETGADLALSPGRLADYLAAGGPAHALILSYMRGHIGDVPRIMAVCEAFGVPVIEDCAHALGATVDGRMVGTFGDVGCWSFQSYKLVDAGEGGMLVSDSDALMRRALPMSGAYEELWRSHLVRPEAIEVNRHPLFNHRMSDLTAAVTRPQLGWMAERVEAGRARYAIVAEALGGYADIPAEAPGVRRAPDSIQFSVAPDVADRLAVHARASGLPLHRFAGENARCYWNWPWADSRHVRSGQRALLERTFDLRLPYWLPLDTAREAVALLAKGWA
jgi:dTDP-4-amino-4,6-dideoxygalactose transaminase